jgi:glycosyltransferase involved in cell wall biosynthesis
MNLRAVLDCHMVGQPEAGDAGNGRYAATFAQALRQTAGPGQSLTTMIAYPGAASELGEGPCVQVPAGNLSRLGHGAARALRGYDAGIFHYVVPPWAPCPLAVVIHDVSFRFHPEWLPRRARLLLNTMVPIAVRRARRVIAVSETVKADTVNFLGVDPDRISVVYPGMHAAFGERPGAAERVFARHGLRDYCLATGDVGPRKNLIALGEAVRRVGGITFVHAGSPGYRGEETLARMGCRTLGRVDAETLADLYAASAVTAMPSLYEGFGLPVVEAMACGAPVLTTRRGSLPEVAGDAAIVTEPDAASLAEGLRAALEPGTASRLREAGPARAAFFSLENAGRTGWAAIEATVR